MFWDYVIGRSKPYERAIPIRPDDIFVVSYFKSGNTWTRFLIGNLLNPDRPVTFESVERIFPDIHQFEYRGYQKLLSPRVIKSHECFDPRYRRVIYIVRDPRDVAISLYHFLRKKKMIDDAFPLATYAAEWFIQGTGSGRTWREHVGSWMVNVKSFPEISGPRQAWSSPNNSRDALSLLDLGARGHGRQFLLVRYEDLIADPCGELARIARFLNVDASGERISKAVEQSSADKMRKLEQTDRERWFMTRGTRKDINFVREAKSEQWRTALPAESLARIESAWGHIIELLGYKLVTLPSSTDLIPSNRTTQTAGI